MICVFHTHLRGYIFVSNTILLIHTRIYIQSFIAAFKIAEGGGGGGVPSFSVAHFESKNSSVIHCKLYKFEKYHPH